MSSAFLLRPHSIGSVLRTKWQRLCRSGSIRPTASAAESSRLEAAQAALNQAMSPAERVHAMREAQAAGVPLHEIERELDWSEGRAAAGIN